MDVLESAAIVHNSMLNDIPRGVHAKLLIVDGTYAYFGSHNLSELGVKAHTKEWGIFTSDPELVQNLRKLYLAFKAEAEALR